MSWRLSPLTGVVVVLRLRAGFSRGLFPPAPRGGPRIETAFIHPIEFESVFPGIQACIRQQAKRLLYLLAEVFIKAPLNWPVRQADYKQGYSESGSRPGTTVRDEC